MDSVMTGLVEAMPPTQNFGTRTAPEKMVKQKDRYKFTCIG